MRRRSGFTLSEVLAVVVILGILAAVVVPQMSFAAEDARPTLMSATVRHIRQQIEYHVAIGDVPLSAGGYPDTIDPDWFMLGRLPKHMWTNLPLILKVETKGADEVYPKKKTFDLNKADKENAWYNTTNGAFCVLVPKQGDEAEELRDFNLANNADVTDKDQTTLGG